jgi:HemY protein
VIRAGLAILIVGVVAVTVLALAGDAGHATVTWLGWRADMTASAATLIAILLALMATLGWRTLLWILEAPQRSQRQRAESRRRQANETLTRGFLAAAAIETAWKAVPHPALWLAFRDLKTSETPRERAKRLTELAAQNPGHRESRLLNVEAALIAGDTLAAHTAIAALDGGPLTARIAGLHARIAYASTQPDEARLWLARGAGAPQEPDWTDLDPEGRAFAYQAADWARLVMTFAETGELIHPRHERREKSLSELPELPIAYADSAAFINADGHEPMLYPPDEAGYSDDDEAGQDSEPAPARRRRRARALPTHGRSS